MISYRFYLLLFISFLPIKHVLAQSDYIDDAALWIGFNLEKKINKHWLVRLEQQNRINENMSSYGRGNIDLGLTFKLNKNLRLMGDYAYLKRPNADNSFTNEHRLFASILLRKNIGKWTCSYRNLFQMRLKDIYSSEEGKIPKFFVRNKIGLKYDINKLVSPYVSYEIYYPLDQSKNKGFSKSRSVIGMEYTINKKTQAEFYFLYQYQLNAFNQTNRDFVYGLSIKREL
jgi:hypothetical protein